jgi:general secretion pathway protein A
MEAESAAEIALMYEAFYGLDERPFDLTPNPRFLLMTDAHRDALSTIQYGISGRKGFTLVLGPAGTGKTTLVHAAIERQQGKGGARAVYIGNPTLTREEFFELLALEFGLSVGGVGSKTQFLRDLHAELLRRHAAGTLTALIIDEAQAMSDQLFEELRLLENFETPSEKLLPVVLVGQPELADRLRQPSLQQLKQRIALRSTLPPLTTSEVAAYIAERIRIAGGDVARIFTPEAVAAVCLSCGGIPRNISVVCDNALVSGFALDERPIGRAIVEDVCRDFDLHVPGDPPAVGTQAFSAATTALARAAEAADGGFDVREPMPMMTNLEMPTDIPVAESLMMHSVREPRPAASTTTRMGSLVTSVRGLRSLISRKGNK